MEKVELNFMFKLKLNSFSKLPALPTFALCQHSATQSLFVAAAVEKDAHGALLIRRVRQAGNGKVPTGH